MWLTEPTVQPDSGGDLLRGQSLISRFVDRLELLEEALSARDRGRKQKEGTRDESRGLRYSGNDSFAKGASERLKRVIAIGAGPADG